MFRRLGILLTVIVMLGIVTGCTTAEFEIDPVNLSNYVITGEPVTIVTDVTNQGNTEGTYSATLKVDDVIIETKEVTIAAGATEKISFTFEIDTSGKHVIDLNGSITEVTAMTPREIMDLVFEAISETKSMQGDMSLTFNMEISQEGEKYEMEALIASDLVIDNENKEMKTVTDVDIDIPGETPVKGTIELYVVDGAIYTRADTSGEDTGWHKESLPADYWKEVEIISGQLDVARDVEVELLRMETLDGINCFVFDILLSDEAIMETILGQQQISDLLGEDIDQATSFISGFLASALDMSMQVWVSEDTLLVKKTVLAGDIDLSSFGFFMNIGAVVNVDKYNEQVEIILPEGALSGTN